MNAIIKRIKEIKPEIVYAGIEYGITVYALFSTVVNLLNMTGIPFCPRHLKPTFFGSSLLVMLLLQYGLILPNQRNPILKKIRPYTMGIIAAGIVSACRFPLCFALLLVLGYFLLTGFPKKYSMQEASLMALTACVGLELYSILILLQENGAEDSVSSFLQSVGPDVLFVLSAILYGAVSSHLRGKNTAEAEMGPETDSFISKADNGNEELNSVGTFARKRRFICRIHHQSQIIDKIRQVLKKSFEWLSDNSVKAVHFIGGILCIITIGVFFYYVLSVRISAQKIDLRREELYVLKHCQDVSLALTLVETEIPNVCKVTFEKYEGKNSQKVFFRKLWKNAYQIIFRESGYALEMSEEYGLSAAPMREIPSQVWIPEISEGKVRASRLFDLEKGHPLYYSLLTDDASPIISVGDIRYENINTYLVLEETIWDEFATTMLIKHYDEFAATILMETILAFFSKWIWLFFILLTLVVFLLIYSRRIIGDKLAVLYGMLFLYMLAYESISSIMLLYIAFGVQWHYAYTYKKRKNQN